MRTKTIVSVALNHISQTWMQLFTEFWCKTCDKFVSVLTFIFMCSQASFQSPGYYQEDGVWGRTVALSAVRSVLWSTGGHSCPLRAVQKRRWTSALLLGLVLPD